MTMRLTVMRSLAIVTFLVHIHAIASFTPPGRNWTAAIAAANAFINKWSLSNLEKANLGSGPGWQRGACVGNTFALSRAGFPGYCLQDSPTGVRFSDFSSAFPAAINSASTWDRDLMYKRGVAMGEEFRGKGINIALAPMMNMGRVAAGGRNWEGAGADPWLTGEVSAMEIIGIQSTGVMACAKHWVGNEQEHGRDTSSSVIDDRTLHEVYGWPFMQSVRADVGSVMCSYNQVNGTYACENPNLLNKVLKQQYGFKGFIMSDWGATHSNAPAANAGLDMTMPGDTYLGSGVLYFGNNLVSAVSSGQMTAARLNDLAVRVLTPYFLLNQSALIPPTNINFVTPNLGRHVNVQGDHAKIIRKVGADSIVMLKNINKALPLSNLPTPSPINFGIIGSDAGSPVNGPNGCADHGCVDGTLAQGWGSGTSNFPYLISPLQAIQYQAGLNGQTVKYSKNDYDLNAATALASSCDTAIVFSFSNSGEAYITVAGNVGDRNNLSLWSNGDNLIQAVANVNQNTIVVIHNVGPVLMPWINHPNITAVLYAGLPGQESGNSLIDVLFGAVNPSEKLVYTVAKNPADYPAQVIYQQGYYTINYSEGLLIDYRWFDAMNITPQFEFGFGLSYTKFSYNNLQISLINTTDTMYNITVSIMNSGLVYGGEVAQLYLGFPAGSGEPPSILRGFDKIFLQPGQSGPITFSLSLTDISIWDVVSQSWQIPPGQFTVNVGASSRDFRLTGSFTAALPPPQSK